jgi:ferric-dicitrate binding protein FerR (iron transport regulator)
LGGIFCSVVLYIGRRGTGVLNKQMEKNVDQIIVRYLTDQISAEERASLLSWRNESLANETYYAEYVAVWERSISSLSDDDYTPDTETSWKAFQQQIEQEPQRKQRYLMPVFRSAGFYQIAASLVLVIGMAYLFHKGSWSSEQNIVKRTADNGDIFYLPDSSVVWLNKHSSLTYSTSFDGSERIVYLKGQAFFDVKRNPKQPFIIHASGTTTEVLGTSFDLKAYDEEDVELTVVTGKVSFTAEQQTLLLLPQDKGVYHRNIKTLALLPHHEENPTELSWMEAQSYEGNSIYEAERQYPLWYTHHTFQWHTNLINQTVIEGMISNSAKVCAYKTVHLKATYISKKDKVLNYHFMVTGHLTPGGTMSYKKKLPDWFKDTKEVRIVVEKVDGAKN